MIYDPRGHLRTEKSLYHIPFWFILQSCFRALPLAAKMGSTAVAIHGGLGPEVVDLAAINGVWRRTEPPRQVGQMKRENVT